MRNSSIVSDVNNNNNIVRRLLPLQGMPNSNVSMGQIGLSPAAALALAANSSIMKVCPHGLFRLSIEYSRFYSQFLLAKFVC